MVVLTYRRKTLTKLPYGGGSIVSVKAQVPDGATVVSVDGDIATLLFPMERKSFESDDLADGFLAGGLTSHSELLEVTRERTKQVLA